MSKGRMKKHATVHKFKGKNKPKPRGRRSVQQEYSQTEVVPNRFLEPNVYEDQVQADELPNQALPSQSNDLDPKSSSARKLLAFQQSLEGENERASAEVLDPGYVIFHKNLLPQLMKSVLCPICSKKSITVEEVGFGQLQHLGIATKWIVKCVRCETTLDTVHSSPRAQQESRAFDINVRLVTAARSTGLGHRVVANLFSGLNLPLPITKKQFDVHQRKVENASTSAIQASDIKVRNTIVDLYKALGHEPLNGVLDIDVSFDGTWHKRGFTSHYGVGLVIEVYSGLAIDYEVLSNFCLVCSSKKDNLQNHDCMKTFHGSSKAMEAEAALRIFERSEEKLGFRYTNVVCDGDSSAFNKVRDSKIYGDGIELKKVECVNHVGKRLGRALRKMVAECKGKCESISGKGKLTLKRIDRQQKLFTLAITQNTGNIEKMEKAIWASLYHQISSDLKYHRHCPDGKETWCKYKKAQVLGEPIPDSKDPLPMDVVKKILPVYERLTDRKLLERCLQNRTQNSNESLNGKIWSKCPKTRCASLRTVRLAVEQALLEFNAGLEYANKSMQHHLGLSQGENIVARSRTVDRTRINEAEKRSSIEYKKGRESSKRQKKQLQDEQEAHEGETYEPGGADI